MVDETTDVHNPALFASGRSEAEAIGQLILYYAARLGVDLVRDAQLPEVPKTSVCSKHGTEHMYNGTCHGTHGFPTEG